MHAWSSTDTWYHHGKSSDLILLDAGWHCSSCFRRISDYQFKMQSYSHSDRLFGNRHWRQLLQPKAILNKICEGKDLFDMLPTYQEGSSTISSTSNSCFLADVELETCRLFWSEGTQRIQARYSC